ncbi:pentapeptide repeat-containing protein, partial [Clostridium sp. ZBS5]|uniref:pentapeptide repeat-containing protein n=1 Tax=Clostridium sp. ZBS5 TaxID=2949973 RepID=UPI002079757D
NLDLMGAIIHRVRFENCKLIGVNFSDATLRNCVFVDCYADYVAFRYANLKWVAFEAGADTNSDFSGAQLVDTYLERLDFDRES